jgi:hypothetical protein
MRRAKAYGTWVSPFVPVEPVREHIEHLQEFGMGIRRISEIAGVSYNAVQGPVYGRPLRSGGWQPTRKIRRESAEKILAVKPTLENLRLGAYIPARGAQRRLQALAVRGWSFSEIGRRLGFHRSNFADMSQRYVTVRSHLKIAALYDQMWNEAPPLATPMERAVYARTIRLARQHRWLPPLAWDDIDNDTEPPVADRDTEPDETAIDLAVRGEAAVRLTHTEKCIAVRRLHAERFSDSAIAARIRVASATVMRIRQDLGLDSLEYAKLRKVGEW